MCKFSDVWAGYAIVVVSVVSLWITHETKPGCIMIDKSKCVQSVLVVAATTLPLTR
jgi:hypothetical protein